MYKYRFLCCCLFCCNIIFSQDNSLIKSIVTDFEQHLQPVNKLYLHTDKSIYSSNEHIWFTGYIFSPDTISAKHTLYVVLADAATKKPVISKQYVIENNLSKGAFFLPDSLKKSNYLFIAYINRTDSLESFAVFSKIITIRDASKKPFKIAAVPANYRIPRKKDSVSAVYRVATKEDRLVKNALVQYSIFWGTKQVYQSKTYTDLSGDFLAVIPASLYPPDAMIHFDVQHEKTTQSFIAPFIIPSQLIYINTYPESGYFINGLQTEAAITAQYQNGKKPVSLNLALVANEDTIDIVTLKNGYGKLVFTPNTGKQYRWTLLDKKTDSISPEITFPKVIDSGYALHVFNALDSNTIRLKIYSNLQKNLYLLAYTKSAVLYSASLQLRKDQGILNIPVADFPSAFTTLVLFDSLGHAVAERTIFPGFERKPVVQMQLDSVEYNKREKVKVFIKTTDENGNPLQTHFSIAAVTASAIDTTYEPTIAAWHLHDSYMKDASDFIYQLPATKEEMENFLLVKAWSKYHWHKPKRKSDSLPINKIEGRVSKAGSLLKKPKQIILLNRIGGNNFSTLTTNEKGDFFVVPEQLYTPADAKIAFFILDNKDNEYTVSVKSNTKDINKQIATEQNGFFSPPNLVTITDEQLLKDATLANVTVIAEKTGLGEVFASKTCNDYVCLYNILNCSNHRIGSKPINGNEYTYQGRQVIYKGCEGDDESRYVQLDGTYYPKEFYKNDYSKLNPTELEAYSTIFWDYAIHTDTSGKATFEFYTNDMSGKVLLHLQGISEKGPFNAKQYFLVRKQKQ